MTDAKRPILDRCREVSQLLRQAYWARDRDDQTMYRAIEHSQNFAVFETKSDTLVGFARVVTDYATVFYLCNVYVEEAFRGRELLLGLYRMIGMGETGLYTELNEHWDEIEQAIQEYIDCLKRDEP